MLTINNTTKWLFTFADKIKKNATYLSDLDSKIGDGDHGSNMVRGVEAMEKELNDTTFSTVDEVFKNSAMALLSKIGGASGPLYGSALIEMAKQTKESENDLTVIVKAGLQGIQKRGKAEQGEKTMVDVWIPVIHALEENNLSNDTIQQALESTKDLKATKGRASYLGDRSVGHLDPGATSSSYFFEAMIESVDYDE